MCEELQDVVFSVQITHQKVETVLYSTVEDTPSFKCLVKKQKKKNKNKLQTKNLRH